MKKILSIFMLLGVVTLLLFINVNAVHGASNNFSVGEVLPATTRLKISWVDVPDISVFTGYDLNHEVKANSDVTSYVFYNYGAEGINFYTKDYLFYEDYGSMLPVGFYVINTFSLSQADRTISTYDTWFDNIGLKWEDLNATLTNFTVGQVLPATTQLRISWYSFYTVSAVVKTDSETFNLINNVTTQTVNGVSITSNATTFQSPYTNGEQNHPYIDIDTSTWSLSKRTISSINNVTNYYSWEDMKAVPSGYERRTLQVGDDLSGKTLYFESNIGITSNDGGGTQTLITFSNGKGICLYDDGSYVVAGLVTYAGFSGYNYDVTFISDTNGAITPSYTLPADIGTVTAIDTSDGSSIPSGAPLTIFNGITADFETITGYSVTYEENGGSIQDDLTEQTVLPALPTPTKSGYNFVGWYYESNFTTQALANDPLSANVTLYAKWSLITYSVTYEENGGSTQTDLTEQTTLPATLPTPTKSGYNFAGWYYESDFTTQAQANDPLSANVTLYAKWSLITYSVTFEENGGSTQTDLTDQSVLPALPQPIKSGSTFQGWYYDSAFTTQAQTNDSLSANVTLYAKWGLNDPKVFEVGDIIPATSQLRIRWTNIVVNPPISVKSDTDSFNLINSVHTGYDDLYINGVIIYDWNQGWYEPYTDYDGNHAYIDINTSTWSLSKRTISTVSLGTANITWKDMVVVDTVAPVWYDVPDGNIAVVGMDSTRTLAELITYYMIDLIDAIDGYIVPTITEDNYTANKTIPGSYTVKLDGVDAAGNHAAQLVLTLNVTDNVAPVWSGVPAGNTLNVNSTAIATLTESLAAIKLTDNIDGDLVYTITEDGYTANKTIPGNYTVKLDGVDAAGNHAILLVLTVHVVDAIAPVWSGVPAGNTYTVNASLVETLNNVFSAIKLTDETDGNIVYVVTYDGYTPNKNIVGAYTVRLGGSDSAGNSATQLVLTINVVDVGAPVWNGVPADNTVTAYSNTLLTLREILSGITLVDSVDGNIIYEIAEDGYTANKNKVGTYTVKLSGSDNAGNSATLLVLTINVHDITKPLWSGTPANNTYNFAVNQTPALSEVIKLIKLIDETDGQLQYVISSDTYTANRTTIGNYTVQLDGIDLSGNHADALVLTIKVETAVPPVYNDTVYPPLDSESANHLNFYNITLNNADATSDREYILPAGYDGFRFYILSESCTNVYIDFSNAIFNFGEKLDGVIWFTIDHSVIIGANPSAPANYSISKFVLWVDCVKDGLNDDYDSNIYFVVNDGIIGNNNLNCESAYIRNIIYLHDGSEVQNTAIHTVSYQEQYANQQEVQDAYDRGHEVGVQEGYQAGEDSAQQAEYARGYNDGSTSSFQAGIKDWIVPAIILVLLIGGYFAIRRKQVE